MGCYFLFFISRITVEAVFIPLENYQWNIETKNMKIDFISDLMSVCVQTGKL